jgi:hypothetical protein
MSMDHLGNDTDRKTKVVGENPQMMFIGGLKLIKTLMIY